VFAAFTVRGRAARPQSQEDMLPPVSPPAAAGVTRGSSTVPAGAPVVQEDTPLSEAAELLRPLRAAASAAVEASKAMAAHEEAGDVRNVGGPPGNTSGGGPLGAAAAAGGRSSTRAASSTAAFAELQSRLRVAAEVARASTSNSRQQKRNASSLEEEVAVQSSPMRNVRERHDDAKAGPAAEEPKVTSVAEADKELAKLEAEEASMDKGSNNAQKQQEQAILEGEEKVEQIKVNQTAKEKEQIDRKLEVHQQKAALLKAKEGEVKKEATGAEEKEEAAEKVKAKAESAGKSDASRHNLNGFVCALALSAGLCVGALAT